MSLGSILVIVAAAQGLDSQSLGQFSFVIASCLVVVSISRGATGEVALVSSSGDSALHSRSLLGAVISAGIALIVPVAVIMAVVLDSGLLLVAGTASVLASTFQDGVRYSFIRAGRRSINLTFSAAVNALQAVGVLVASTLTHNAVWVTWAYVAGIVFPLVVLGFLPERHFAFSLVSGIHWLRSNASRSTAYVLEVVSGALVGYSIAFFLVYFLDASLVAAFRTTVSVFGLTSVLINFARASVQRELFERQAAGRLNDIVRPFLKMSAFFAVGVGSALGLLLLTPPELGMCLFGPTWLLITPVLLLGGVDRLAACMSVVPTIILRALGVIWSATRARIVICVAGVALSPFSIMVGGVAGAFLAEIFVYSCLFGVLTFVLFRFRVLSRS